MKRALALLLTAFVLLLAACGGSSSTPGGNDNGNGGGSSAEASTEASVDAQPSESADSGGGGGSGGSLDQIAERLIPPNSTETSKTTASGVIFVAYESTDSPDSLKGFYESAFGDIGWQVFSTTSAGGSYSWIAGESENSPNAGVVTVAPGSSGSGSTVVIQVGAGG